MSDTANHPAAIRPTTASTPAPTCIVTVVPAHDERELLPRCLRALQRVHSARRCRCTPRSYSTPARTTPHSSCPPGSPSWSGVCAMSAPHAPPASPRAVSSAAPTCGSRPPMPTPSSGLLVRRPTHLLGRPRRDGRDRARRLGRTRRRDPAPVRRRLSPPPRIGPRPRTRREPRCPRGRLPRGRGIPGAGNRRGRRLVTRLGSAGHRVAWDEHTVVTTSDRRDPRAPRGFGDHLLSIAAAPDPRRPLVGVRSARHCPWSSDDAERDGGASDRHPRRRGAVAPPGSGQTRKRWSELADAARRDLVGARLLEAHADAVAILAELHGPSPRPGELWACGPPNRRRPR